MQIEKNQTTRHKANDARAVSRVGLIDTETGEVLDGGKVIYVPPKLRIKGFFMADQKGFEELAKSDLTGEAFRVLMLMMGRMDYENAITLSQKEIGEALTMKKQNVSRAIKSLRSAGVFEAESDHVIHLATELGWKGKVQNLRTRQATLFKEIRARSSPCADDLATMDAQMDSLPKFSDTARNL